MNFISIDVETANPSRDSICQIGMVKFKNGEIVDVYNQLINPEDYFDDFNESIHGITESKVKNSPTFIDEYSKIKNFIDGFYLVAHSGFDKSAFDQASKKYNLEPFDNAWIDSMKVARRTWDFCRDKGYGLSKLSKKFNIELSHHDASSDARACGLIFIEALKEYGSNIEKALIRSNKPLSGNEKLQFESNKDGILFGETVCFTGTLSITRNEASILAAQAGCEVSNSVKKITTILVIGDIDKSVLSAGNDKTAKQLKAEKLINDGYDIQILMENDFMQMVKG